MTLVVDKRYGSLQCTGQIHWEAYSYVTKFAFLFRHFLCCCLRSNVQQMSTKTISEGRIARLSFFFAADQAHPVDEKYRKDERSLHSSHSVRRNNEALRDVTSLENSSPIKQSVIEPSISYSRFKRDNSKSLPDNVIPKPPTGSTESRKSFPATNRRGKFQYRSGNLIEIYTVRKICLISHYHLLYAFRII